MGARLSPQAAQGYLEILRDNLTSTSVKVVPLTIVSNFQQISAKNIAPKYWLHYSSKTTNRNFDFSAVAVVFEL